MTIERTNVFSGPLTGNGVTVAFPFDFHAASVAEVAVQLNGVDVDPAQYTVTLNADGTGTATFFVAPVGQLYVYSTPLFTQEVDFEDQGPFYQSSVNEPIDRSAIRDLALKGMIDRAIIMPPFQSGIELPRTGKAGRFLGFDTDEQLRLMAGTGSATDASQVALVVAEADANARNVRDKFNREAVSILDFKNDNGTIPGSGGDDTSAFVKAFASGRKVRIPNGIRIKCNVLTPPSFWIEGDTTKLSMIEPFDKTKPAIKVVWDNLYWSYCRVIQNIMFINADPASVGYVARKGIGVAMGRAGVDDFENVGPYPMYSGGMVFRNVVFRDLFKGFVSGCGNIGVEFFTCNAASCYYGFYFQDNKNTAANGNAGGSFSDGMHAGNKYFYGGEIDDCDCGVYIHNVTEGFGAIAFYGTIIEYNKIGVYLYSNNVFFPIAFHDVWNEGNGQAAFNTPRPSNVIVDAWAGGVRSDKPVLPRTLIVEGTRVAVNFDGGFFTDVRMTATNSRITVRDAQVEYQLGYGGSGHYVDDPSSKIIFESPKTLGGIGAFMNVMTRGVPHIEFAGGAYDPTIGGNASQAGARHFHAPPRLNKQYGQGQYASGTTEGVSIGYTRARPFTGFASYTPTIGPGGRLFPVVSNFDITTTSGAQFLLDSNASVTTGLAGWWVVSYDIRRLDGLDIAVFIGDLSGTQILSAVPTVGTEWMTIVALAYLPAGRTFFPSFQPVSPGRSVFQFSAYQARRFNTRMEAEAFIADDVYIVEQDDMFMDANVQLRWRSGGILPWRFGPNPVTGAFEWSADPATAKRLDIDGFGFKFDATYPHRFVWGGGAGEYRFGVDTVAGDMIMETVAGGSGVFRCGVHINLNGKELRVSGNKVVGARGASVAAAVQSAAAPTKAEFDALVAVVNALRDRLRVTGGHGLIAD